jgi:hypothetical protein
MLRQAQHEENKCVLTLSLSKGEEAEPIGQDPGYTEKLVPQPQEAVALGLLTLKAAPIRSST